MTTKKHGDFVRVLRTHELALSAGAGFHLPEEDFEIIIRALRIAARASKPKPKKKEIGRGYKFGYHGFE